MESKNKFIKATSKDNYSSILIKIIKQDNNHTKLIVYHMFEYIKPEIVHSKLFLEYLKIWDNEFYFFLIEKKREIKKLNRKYEIYYWIRLVIKGLVNLLSIVIIFILFVVLNITSFVLMIKLMEFIVKLFNGNLDDFSLLEVLSAFFILYL